MKASNINPINLKEKIFCGIDFHKVTSTLCSVYEDGSEAEPITKIKTAQLVQYLSNRKTFKIAIEVSGGVNPMVEKLRSMGHDVSLINSNKFRGIGIGGKKTDARDARALAEGLRLNFIPTVHLRSRPSREIKSLLTTREHCVQGRCRAINHVRGTLREYGFPMPAGAEEFYLHSRATVDGLSNEAIKQSLLKLLENIKSYKEQEKLIEESLKSLTQDNPQIKQLQSIPGVGPMTALAMICVIDDITRFKNAKEFASYIGLVPRVHASAEKRMMGAITRSGCEMLRRYLIHGARAWMRYSAKGGDSNRAWAQKVEERRGKNKATVALAHRLARICFAVMRDQCEYKKTIKKEYTNDEVAA
jgi:transposase